MTPTRIQAIRDRCQKRYQVNGITACGRDLDALLTAWDTRDTALRALVQQWRDKATWEMHLVNGLETSESEARRLVLAACAEAVDRLLASED